MGKNHLQGPARVPGAATETLVHSPGRKDKKPAPSRSRPDQSSPARSRLGNPFPAGLRPVLVDETLAADTDVEAAWSRNDYAPGAPQHYLHVRPAAEWPRLDLHLARRRPHETDEQYAIYRRCFERFTCAHAVWLGLCQRICTGLGNHRACREGACRRNGVCAGVRDQTRYWLPLLVYPPCVPLDREIMETYREEIKAEVRRLVGRDQAPLPVARPAK
ncbi:hypothetical protein ABUE29_25940, partial [Mesorhizobium sp. ZMM04-4]